MPGRFVIALLSAGLFALAAVGARADTNLPAEVGGVELPSLAPVVEKIAPGVVNIATKGHVEIQQNPLFNDPFFRRFFGLPEGPIERETQSVGSGVVVDAENGYVITNSHVVANADEIVVIFRDKRRFEAELVGTDPETDVAVLKIEPDNLTALSIGDSEALRVGDFVVAMGNPFGLSHTVTLGIVSALGRTGLGIEGYEDFIQTDASINPGNSGGALVNMDGELVGINSAIISRSGGNVGIGFAVATEIAKSVMRQILDFGEVHRGLLGVSIRPIDAADAEARNVPVDSGAIITEITANSAAEKAGLQIEDIIIEVNSRKISDARELTNAIGLLSAGDKVTIRYVRGGESHETTAELGERVTTRVAGGDIHRGLNGAEFQSTTASSVRGIEVPSVADGSAAAQRGLRQGDVVLAVNRQRVQSIDELVEVASENQILFLIVQRGNRQLTLQIR